MNTEISRESDHTYLTLKDYKADENSYSLKMAQNCSFSSLIPVTVCFCDGISRLRYDITGFTSLSSRYSSTAMKESDISRLLYALRDVSQKLPEYLLDSDDLLLDPDMIYLSPGEGGIRFLYVPDLGKAEEKPSVRLLAEFLLKHTDHGDPAAADASYGFYEIASDENQVLSGALPELLKKISNMPGASGMQGSFGQAPGASGMQGSFGQAPGASGMQQGTLPGADPYGMTASSPSPADDFAVFGSPAAGPGPAGQAGPLTSGRAFAGPDGPQTGGRAFAGPAGPQTGGRTFAGPDGRAAAGPARLKPDGRSRVKGSRHPQKASLPRAVRQKKQKDRNILVLLALLAALVCGGSIVLFHLDPAQIGGVILLSIALIWLVRQQLYKKSGDLQNIWSDEDEDLEDDDTFYQNILDQVHARQLQPAAGPAFDMQSPGRSPGPSFSMQNSGTFSPGFQAGAGFTAPSAGFQTGADFPASSAGFQAGADFPAPSAGFQAAPGFTAPSAPGPSAASSAGSPQPYLFSLDPAHYNDIPLMKNVTVIGKSARECDICIRSDTISRSHAKIERTGDDWYLTDLFSTNGTFMDGRKLEPNHPVRLEPGSEVSFARYRYRAFRK